jgi:hypothetical protein
MNANKGQWPHLGTVVMDLRNLFPVLIFLSRFAFIRVHSRLSLSSASWRGGSDHLKALTHCLLYALSFRFKLLWSFGRRHVDQGQNRQINP